jgi:transcriptional regulator with XRE-family HTH domain
MKHKGCGWVPLSSLTQEAGEGRLEGMNRLMERYQEVKATGLTMKAIGEKLGLAESSIWKILTDKRGTRYKVAVGIGQALGMIGEEIIEAWKDIMIKAMDREIDTYDKAKKKPSIIPKTRFRKA